MEYCGVASRTVPLLMVMMSYTLASLTLPWVAMVMPSWRLLSLTAALAILPILAGFKWVDKKEFKMPSLLEINHCAVDGCVLIMCT